MDNEEKPRKRRKYVTDKRTHLENLMSAGREYVFKYSPKLVNLQKDVSEVQDLTRGACLFPNTYLDNDDSCVKCKIYENCACSKKNLGKKRR